MTDVSLRQIMLWSPEYFTPVHSAQHLCAEYTMDAQNPQHSVFHLTLLHIAGEAGFKHTACTHSIQTTTTTKEFCFLSTKWQSVSFAGVQLHEMRNDSSFKWIWTKYVRWQRLTAVVLHKIFHTLEQFPTQADWKYVLQSTLLRNTKYLNNIHNHIVNLSNAFQICRNADSAL